jgi:hypothetical protein
LVAASWEDSTDGVTCACMRMGLPFKRVEVLYNSIFERADTQSVSIR